MMAPLGPRQLPIGSQLPEELDEEDEVGHMHPELLDELVEQTSFPQVGQAKGAVRNEFSCT